MRVRLIAWHGTCSRKLPCLPILDLYDAGENWRAGERRGKCGSETERGGGEMFRSDCRKHRGHQVDEKPTRLTVER